MNLAHFLARACLGLPRPAVSQMAPRCLPGGSQMAPRCLPYVSQMSPRCLPAPRCLQDVSQMSARGLPGVSQMSSRCLSDVSKVSLRCLPDVSQMSLRCVPDVSQMCSSIGHILVLRCKTCALLRAKTSALLRRKTRAVLRARRADSSIHRLTGSPIRFGSVLFPSTSAPIRSLLVESARVDRFANSGQLADSNRTSEPVCPIRIREPL